MRSRTVPRSHENWPNVLGRIRCRLSGYCARSMTADSSQTSRTAGFALTALGEMLRSDVPGSARRGAIVSTEEWRWRAYGYLTLHDWNDQAPVRILVNCGAAMAEGTRLLAIEMSCRLQRSPALP